jgi:hypothetical protein
MDFTAFFNFFAKYYVLIISLLYVRPSTIFNARAVLRSDAGVSRTHSGI